jgi:pimeloyl-ACP methyl ester carboxylesterase
MTKKKQRIVSTQNSQLRWPAVAAVAAAAGLIAAARVRKRTREAEAADPPIGNFMRVKGVDLHYTDSGGEMPAIVLLHGNGAMIQDFEISGLVDRLARHHRVIVFDRPGYGYSTRPRHIAWTPEAQAALFHEAVRELGISKPLVLGHSWGSLVALAMGLLYRLHVSGLILASGYYFPTARADVVLLSPPAIPLIGGVMRYTVAPFIGELIAPGAIRKMFAPQSVSEAFHEEFPLGLALRPVQIRASSEEAAMMVPAAARLEEHYGELDVPVTIIAGVADEIVDPQRQAMALHHAIPQSRLMVVSGAGHMVHHQALEDVAEAVEAFSGKGKASERMPSSRRTPKRQANGKPADSPDKSGQTWTH